jgi:hypothetical protein
MVPAHSLRRRHRAQAHVRRDYDEPRGVRGAQTGQERPGPARQGFLLLVILLVVVFAAETGERRGARSENHVHAGVPPSQRREVEQWYTLALGPTDDTLEPLRGRHPVVQTHGAQLDEPELGHRVGAEAVQ